MTQAPIQDNNLKLNPMGDFLEAINTKSSSKSTVAMTKGTGSDFSNFLNNLNSKAQNVQSSYKTDTINSTAANSAKNNKTAVKTNTSSINKKVLNSSNGSESAKNSAKNTINNNIKNAQNDNSKETLSSSTKNQTVKGGNNTASLDNSETKISNNETIKQTPDNKQETKTDKVSTTEVITETDSKTDIDSSIVDNSPVDPSSVIFLDKNTALNSQKEADKKQELLSSISAVLNSNSTNKTDTSSIDETIDSIVNEIENVEDLTKVVEILSDFLNDDNSNNNSLTQLKDEVETLLNKLNQSNKTETSFENELNLKTQTIENKENNVLEVKNKTLTQTKVSAPFEQEENQNNKTNLEVENNSSIDLETLKKEVKETLKEVLNNNETKTNSSDNKTDLIFNKLSSLVDSLNKASDLKDETDFKTEILKLTDEIKTEITKLENNNNQISLTDLKETVKNIQETISNVETDKNSFDLNSLKEEITSKVIDLKEKTASIAENLKEVEVLDTKTAKIDLENLKIENKKDLDDILDLLTSFEENNSIEQPETSEIINSLKEKLTELKKNFDTENFQTEVQNKAAFETKVQEIQPLLAKLQDSNDFSKSIKLNDTQKTKNRTSLEINTNADTLEADFQPKTDNKTKVDLQEELNSNVLAKNETKPLKTEGLPSNLETKNPKETNSFELKTDKTNLKTDETNFENETVTEENVKQTKVSKGIIDKLKGDIEFEISRDDLALDNSEALSAVDEVKKISIETEPSLNTNADFKGSVIYDAAFDGKIIKNINIAQAQFKNPLNNALETNDILNQLTNKIQQLKDNQGQKLTMVLRPNDLGRLSIELKTDSSGLTTNIIAQNDEVRAYIEKNIHQLQKQLNANGVSVNNIQIKTSGQENNSNYNSNRNFEQDTNNQENNNHNNKNDNNKNDNNNQQSNRQNQKEINETLAKMSNFDYKFQKDFSSVLNKSINYSLG